MKYRLKLEDSRVVGPFSIKELKKLKEKGKLSVKNSVQEFPDGEWTTFNNVKDLEHIFEDDKNVREETFMHKLKNINLQRSDELSKTVVEKVDLEQAKEDTNKVNLLEAESEENPEDQNLEEIEEDKTKINPEYQKYLDDLKKAQEKEEKERKKERDKQAIVIKPDYENEATQMVSLDDIEKDLAKAIRADVSFEKDLEQFEKNRAREKKNDPIRHYEDTPDSDEKKKKKNFIMIGLFLVLILFLFDSEDENEKTTKNLKILSPEIIFPTKFDTPDKVLANKYYTEGIEILRKNNEIYASKLKALKSFRLSAKNQFHDNPALAKLIFYYSDVLDNSKDKLSDSNTVFKLVQIFNNKIFSDPEFASAASYFYYKVGKFSAAIRIFDKYMTASKSKASAGEKVRVTTELYSVRLLSLIAEGKLNLAKNVADKLFPLPNKSIFTYKALIEFYKVESKLKVYPKLIKEGQERFSSAVYFDIESGHYAIENNAIKDLKKMILSIVKKKAEYSSTYYSQLFTLKGFYFALLGKVKKATQNFNKALSFHESQTLINKLALLEKSEDEGVNKLVENSKAKRFMMLSKRHEIEKDFASALKYALKASDQAPSLLGPKLNLAKLQIKRGYIQDAINILEELYSDNSLKAKQRENVLFELIDAYTVAFKFKKVFSLLHTARNMTSTESYKYAKAQAKYYTYKGDFDLAVIKTSQAQGLNPLDDSNIYELAKLYIKFHKYQRAKNTLNRAMELDPSNIEYKVLFADVIYEMENSEAAIGYLFNILEDFPDHPMILSSIGIYYYRSGRIKRYERIKAQLMDLPKTDKSLYAFLIESARLDDDLGKLIKYSEDLVSLDPGDLKTRMDLAILYIENEKYKKAKYHLQKVEERLPTYPKLQYLYAKLYYFIDDFDKSKEMVEKEIKENPTVVDSYLLLADIYMKKNKVTEARAEYIKAIQIDKKNVDAILGMAFVALKMNKYDMAIDQYNKAKEIAPNNSEVYRLLGDAYRLLGQSQLAISNYKQFLELSSNSKYKDKIETYIKTMQ